MIIAMFVAPRRIMRAWKSARGTRNLYHRDVPYDSLLEMKVEELRDMLGNSSRGLSMNRDELRDVSLGRLVPFGVEVTAADPATDLRSMGLNFVKGLVEENRVVIMRGFASLPGDEFPEFCRRFGELQQWDFGVVNNLQRRI